MGKINWIEVQTAIEEVLDLPREEQIPYIEKKYSHSEELKSEITQLLQSIFDSEGWLENPEEYKYDLFTPAPGNSEPSAMTGEKIGPYRIKNLIGHGGMGSVFFAERDDGHFEQTVALKLIRREMATPENIARFRREQHILAGLSHPNIARLYDGGVTSDGLPYLIMEYIDGQSITDYCNEKKLNIRERLNLFKQVCRAVQYAHSNLVIHRDLKPDNILVTGSGEIKVLDFGIARLLEEDPESALIQTREGGRILTLRYAAPEQVAGNKLTTAVDIYALGTLFYQLVTGIHPFELKEKERAEIESVIKNSNAPHPFTRFSGIPAERQKELAEKRSARPAELASYLKGDLAAVLLKTLRKEPEARYESAGEFLEDLNRFSRNLPVTAREGTVRYHTGKFIKRHMAGLAVTVVFILMITGFGLFYTLQIADERNQARLEAEKAEEVTDFLVSLFSRSNPYLENMEGGTEVPVGSILKFGTEKIDDELADQPVIRAELKTVLGEVYNELNDFEMAESLLLEAADIRKSSDDISHFETATTLRNLAFLYQEQGDFDKAETLLREAISYFNTDEENLYTHNAISTIARLGNLTWYNKGDYETADSLLQKTLQLRKTLHTEEHVHIAINYNDLATLYHAKGDYETAEPYYQESISIYTNQTGEHSNLAIIMGNFSALLKERGNYGEAENFQRRSLEMHRKLTGEENVDIALGNSNLGSILLEQNRLEEADSLMNLAFDQLEKIYGSSHTYTARVKLNMGRLYMARHDFSMAEETLLETLDEYSDLYPEEHPRLSDPLIQLGKLYLLQQKPEKAESYLQEALQIRTEGYGEDNWRTAQAMSYLGACLYQLDEYEQAEPLLTGSYEILNDKRGKEDRYRTEVLQNIIQLYEDWNKPDEKELFQNRL